MHSLPFKLYQDILFSQKLDIEFEKSLMKVANFGVFTLFLLVPRPKNCKCLDNIMVLVLYNSFRVVFSTGDMGALAPGILKK